WTGDCGWTGAGVVGGKGRAARGRNRCPSHAPSRRSPSPGRSRRGSPAGVCSEGVDPDGVPADRAVALGDAVVVGGPVDDLQTDDLPGRQPGGPPVLPPQAQRHGRGVVQVAGLLPVADLRVVVGVAAGEQEGVVVGELFQGAADVLDGGPFAGDAEGDVPQAGQVAGFSAVEAVPGRDAGEGAFLAGRPGAGTTAGRRRPRAYSSHDGLLRARTGPRVGRMCPWDKVEQAAGAR